MMSADASRGRCRRRRLLSRLGQQIHHDRPTVNSETGSAQRGRADTLSVVVGHGQVSRAQIQLVVARVHTLARVQVVAVVGVGGWKVSITSVDRMCDSWTELDGWMEQVRQVDESEGDEKQETEGEQVGEAREMLALLVAASGCLVSLHNLHI